MPAIGTDHLDVPPDVSTFGASVRNIGVVRANKHAIRATFARPGSDICASFRSSGTFDRSSSAKLSVHDAVVRGNHARLPTNDADLVDNHAIVSFIDAFVRNKCALVRKQGMVVLTFCALRATGGTVVREVGVVGPPRCSLRGKLGT